MSLIESDFFHDLLIPEEITPFDSKTFLSDNNLNDILSELSEEPPKKGIKFILTKEEAPSLTLLKKKINLKQDDTNKGNSNGGRWNKDEQYRFAEAVLKYGNDWKKIQSHIYTRNITQIRSHAQKFLMKLKETNFIKKTNLDQNLSWTKVMNYLRSNVQYNDLKELLFSVEQNDDKKEEKKKKKKPPAEWSQQAGLISTVTYLSAAHCSSGWKGCRPSMPSSHSYPPVCFSPLPSYWNPGSR